MNECNDHRMLGIRAAYRCIDEMLAIDADYYDKDRKVLGSLNLCVTDLFLPIEFIKSANENLGVSMSLTFFIDDDKFLYRTLRNIIKNIDSFTKKHEEKVMDSEYTPQIYYAVLRTIKKLMNIYPDIIQGLEQETAKILCYGHRTETTLIESFLKIDTENKLTAALIQEMLNTSEYKLKTTIQKEHLNILDQCIFDYFKYELEANIKIDDKELEKKILLMANSLAINKNPVDVPIKAINCLIPNNQEHMYYTELSECIEFKQNLEQYVKHNFEKEYLKIETLANATGISAIEAYRIVMDETSIVNMAIPSDIGQLNV